MHGPLPPSEAAPSRRPRVFHGLAEHISTARRGGGAPPEPAPCIQTLADASRARSQKERATTSGRSRVSHRPRPPVERVFYVGTSSPQAPTAHASARHGRTMSFQFRSSGLTPYVCRGRAHVPRPLATLDRAHHFCPLPRLVYPLAFLGHPPRSCDGRAKGARLLPPSLGTAHPRGVQLGWHRPSVILAPSLRLACGHAREKSLDRVLPGSFSRAAAHELVPTPPSPLLECPCPTPPPPVLLLLRVVLRNTSSSSHSSESFQLAPLHFSYYSSWARWWLPTWCASLSWVRGGYRGFVRLGEYFAS